MKKIVFFSFLIALFILLPNNITYADSPPHTKAVVGELIGADSAELLAQATTTILSITIQQSGTASNSWVSCGTTIVTRNYAKDFVVDDIHYLCANQAINIEKTGNDDAFFIISYVEGDLLEYESVDKISGTLVNTSLLVFLWGAVFLLVIFLIRKFNE